MKKNISYLLLIFITILWGVSYPVMDFTLTYITPYNFVMIRYILASICMTIIFWKTIKTIDRTHLKFGFYIGLPFTIAVISQIVGLNLTTSTNAAFITGLTVIIVPLLMWMFEKTKISIRTIIGIVGSLVGVAIMTHTAGIYKLNIGDIIVFIGTVGFSFQIYLLGKFGSRLNGILLTIIQFYLVSICTIPFVDYGEISLIKFDTKLLFALIFIVFVCTVFTITIQNVVQHNVVSAHVGVIFLIEPITSMGVSRLLGETITLYQTIGAILIIISMLVIVLES